MRKFKKVILSVVAMLISFLVYKACLAQDNNIWLPLVSSLDPASIPTPIVITPTPMPTVTWWEIDGKDCKNCFLFGDWNIWSAAVDCNSPQPMYLRFKGDYYPLNWENIDRIPAVGLWHPQEECFYTVSMKSSWGATTSGANDPKNYVFTGYQ